MTAAVIGLLLVIAVGGSLLSLYLRDALADLQVSSDQATERLRQSHLERARALRASGRVGQRFEALQAIRQAAQMRITPEVRSAAAAALVLPDVEVAEEWRGWPEHTVGVSLDAAFQRYARLDRQGSVAVCRIRDGREEVSLRLPAHGQPRFDAVSLSPDGRFVIYRHSAVRKSEVAKACVWKIDGPAPTLVIDVPSGHHGEARAFHSSGKQLAIALADNFVGVYDLATGQLMQRLPTGAAPKLPLQGSTVAKFSPDGRWLMTNTSGAGCRLWEAGTWREVRRFHDAGFAFSPDSRLLALGDVFSVIRLVETTTGREVARLTGPEPVWYLPACFTPDGTRLISNGPDPSSLYVWDLRLIRRQLKELDLDWDWPQFGEPDASQQVKPNNVEVLPGALR
jgi:hypothetical protein